MLTSRIVEACTPWEITETTHLYELTIREGAQIIAPEGKFLTLTVNGCGYPIRPGFYTGDVVVSVTEPYSMPPHGLHLNFGEMLNHGAPLGPEYNVPMNQAAVIYDGKLDPAKTVPAILQEGTITDTEADGLYVASSEDDFCGIIIEGASKYAVRNSTFDLEGNGTDDWQGKGVAVAVADDSEVEVDHCRFHYAGHTRCMLQAGGRSKVTVRNSEFLNMAPDGSDWVGTFSWQIGFRGHNRLTQLSDNATIVYENCRFHGNGWGIASIDGTGDAYPRPDDPAWEEGLTPGYAVTMTMKDCDLSLSGPRQHGYGAFCIGDNHITFDHTRADVFGYPVLLMGMEQKGRFDVVNGSEITGRRFGALITGDENSVLNIADSSFRTGKSSIVCKGSATTIKVSNSTFTAGNNVILQLMDTDEGGMNKANFVVPVGIVDQKDPSLDLSKAAPKEDVIMELTGCTISGNFFNSTTNIRAAQRGTVGGMGKLHDRVLGIIPPAPADAPNPTALRHNGNDLKGAKNMVITLADTRITGIISSAEQHYRKDLFVITADNGDELSNVTQTAAPTINNGVIVSLDSASAWTVTGTSYITALTLAEGAAITGANGQKVTMTVDGVETAIVPGTYTGAIVLSI